MSNRKLVGSGATTGVCLAHWAIGGRLALAVEIAAALSLGDASWDFRNYHLYNAFALLNKPFGVDIAPAHMQYVLFRRRWTSSITRWRARSRTSPS